MQEALIRGNAVFKVKLANEIKDANLALKRGEGRGGEGGRGGGGAYETSNYRNPIRKFAKFQFTVPIK